VDYTYLIYSKVPNKCHPKKDPQDWATFPKTVLDLKYSPKQFLSWASSILALLCYYTFTPNSDQPPSKKNPPRLPMPNPKMIRRNSLLLKKPCESVITYFVNVS
jgi:hypothetical protein